MKTRVPWILLAVGAVVVVPVLWLSILNDSIARDGPFIVLAVLAMTGWATVGALLTSRNPSNPIGWLMLAFGLGFLVAGFSDEWATYALRTEPGGLPLAMMWAWVTSWVFIPVVLTVPVMLLLYPTGSVLSRRWRWVLWADGLDPGSRRGRRPRHDLVAGGPGAPARGQVARRRRPRTSPHRWPISPRWTPARSRCGTRGSCSARSRCACLRTTREPLEGAAHPRPGPPGGSRAP